MPGVPLPLSILSHRWAAVTSPAPRQTLVEERMTGQGRGRWIGGAREGQVDRRGRGGE